MKPLLSLLLCLSLLGCAVTEKQLNRVSKACYGLLLVPPVALGVSAAVICDLGTDELPIKADDVELPSV